MRFEPPLLAGNPLAFGYTLPVIRAVRILMIALCLFAACGPLAEAASCDQACVTGSDGEECATDLCCSCCVHFRIDPPRLGGAAPHAGDSRPIAAAVEPPQLVSDPREVLHVPKPVPL